MAVVKATTGGVQRKFSVEDLILIDFAEWSDVAIHATICEAYGMTDPSPTFVPSVICELSMRSTPGLDFLQPSCCCKDGKTDDNNIPEDNMPNQGRYQHQPGINDLMSMCPAEASHKISQVRRNDSLDCDKRLSMQLLHMPFRLVDRNELGLEWNLFYNPAYVTDLPKDFRITVKGIDMAMKLVDSALTEVTAYDDDDADYGETDIDRQMQGALMFFGGHYTVKREKYHNDVVILPEALQPYYDQVPRELFPKPAIQYWRSLHARKILWKEAHKSAL